MDEDKAGYTAMTVNERLSVAGLIDQWDAAVSRRDRAGMIDVLKVIGLKSEAERTADAVLKNPTFYGFK